MISKLHCDHVQNSTNLQQGIWRFMALSSRTASQKSRSLRMGKVLGSAWLRPPQGPDTTNCLLNPVDTNDTYDTWDINPETSETDATEKSNYC
jgi:hypothetical protein